jgi:hypothetical protein
VARLTCRLEVGRGESEVRSLLQAEDVMHLGTEGRLAEGADGVEREIEGAGTNPGGGVVEGLVGVVRRSEGGRRRGGGVPRGGGLMLRAATSGDERGTAGEGAGAERQPLVVLAKLVVKSQSTDLPHFRSCRDTGATSTS